MKVGKFEVGRKISRARLVPKIDPLRVKKLELRISRILYAMIIHLGWMLPSTSSGYLRTRRATSTCPRFTLLQTGFT